MPHPRHRGVIRNMVRHRRPGDTRMVRRRRLGDTQLQGMRRRHLVGLMGIRWPRHLRRSKHAIVWLQHTARFDQVLGAGGGKGVCSSMCREGGAPLVSVAMHSGRVHRPSVGSTRRYPMVRMGIRWP